MGDWIKKALKTEFSWCAVISDDEVGIKKTLGDDGFFLNFLNMRAKEICVIHAVFIINYPSGRRDLRPGAGCQSGSDNCRLLGLIAACVCLQWCHQVITTPLIPPPATTANTSPPGDSGFAGSCRHHDIIPWTHWPFLRGTHRSSVASPHKRTVIRSFGMSYISHVE